MQSKYLRPENCTNLVAPKVNKQIWQQLRQETKNNDSAFQKAQSLLLSGLCAVLQTCNSSSGEQKNVLTHAAVLLLSTNRDLIGHKDKERTEEEVLCSPAELSQSTVVSIIANQTPFKAGGLQ